MVSFERDDIVPIALLTLVAVCTYMTWNYTNQFIQLMATRLVMLNPYVFILIIGGFGIVALVLCIFAGPFVQENQFMLSALTLITGMILGLFLWQFISSPLSDLNNLVYTTIGGGFPYTGYDWSDITQVTMDYMQLQFIQYVNSVVMWISVWYTALVGTATAAIATTD